MKPEARERRIRELFPLVRRIARRLHRLVPAASYDDLIGDGSIGLIRAVDTFDAARGVALEGYARKVIAGTMLNGLRRMDPISERTRRRIRRAEQERYRLAQERGTMPTMTELESSFKGLHQARTVVFRHTPLSLDAPLPRDENALLDIETDPALHIVRKSVARDLREALALLPLRQRRIMLLHYYQQQSLHAISAQLNVTPQRISQLHVRALSKLRAAIPTA